MSFNLDSDSEIGKVDPDYLSEILTKMDTGSSDALFISCTALPALKILDQVEISTFKPYRVYYNVKEYAQCNKESAYIIQSKCSINNRNNTYTKSIDENRS